MRGLQGINLRKVSQVITPSACRPDSHVLASLVLYSARTSYPQHPQKASTPAFGPLCTLQAMPEHSHPLLPCCHWTYVSRFSDTLPQSDLPRSGKFFPILSSPGHLICPLFPWMQRTSGCLRTAGESKQLDLDFPGF